MSTRSTDKNESVGTKDNDIQVAPKQVVMVHPHRQVTGLGPSGPAEPELPILKAARGTRDQQPMQADGATKPPRKTYTPGRGLPLVTRRITREELREVVAAATLAAQSAVAASEVALAAIEQEESGPHPIGAHGQVPRELDPVPHPRGDGDNMSLDQFMAKLRPIIKLAGVRLAVTDNKSWVKIVGQHDKVYISKGKLSVGRVESTLAPDVVEGSVAPPEDRDNGRIRSWIPADTTSVSAAIRYIAGLK